MANEQKPPRLPRDAPAWMHCAAVEIGVKERPGAQSHPRILEYYRATTLGGNPEDSSTPWCSAFVNWVMEYSGFRGTRRANARSWLSYGVESEPKLGAIIVLWREEPDSAKGHVGFFAGKEGENRVWILGGNQNNAVGYQLYGVGRVLGYRWPTDRERKGG